MKRIGTRFKNDDKQKCQTGIICFKDPHFIDQNQDHENKEKADDRKLSSTIRQVAKREIFVDKCPDVDQ